MWTKVQSETHGICVKSVSHLASIVLRYAFGDTDDEWQKASRKLNQTQERRRMANKSATHSPRITA
jgi:hypothetical protein